MKKNLSPLTVIVLLITILIAGACRMQEKVVRAPAVIIHLIKIVEIDGVIHLEMSNSYAPGLIVVDSLWTDVNPGDTIIWLAKPQSGIKAILDVRPVKKEGKIFKEAAIEASYKAQKAFMTVIPDDAEPGSEKYEIVFTDNDNRIWCIDPYLRIPGREATEETEDSQDPLP
ncbi:MAG: hypothetical protein KFF49_01975 [Bacteroidales bacterium]|nr:hypothetical protein [Bacteroidales bacterium]